MTQTIVISSGKGVGKTQIGINVAIELAQRNYRTCLFDAHPGPTDVSILLGNQPKNTLDDYIFGNKNPHELILRTEYGIDIIPGNLGMYKMANLTQEDIVDFVASFAQIRGYDYFLIDTASRVSSEAIAFCLAGSQTIIVITAEATSLAEAYALLKMMAGNNYKGTVKILVNKSPSLPAAKETYLRFKDVVSRHLKIDITPAGVILDDPKTETSLTRQEPALLLSPDSLACRCIRSMVAHLIKSDAGPHQEDDLKKFWQRYFDYARQDPALPKRSFQLRGPAGTYENHNQTISPFTERDGIFALDTLPIPTPLLAKALTLQARGELTEEILLDFFCCDPVLMAMAIKLLNGSATGDSRSRQISRRQQIIEQLGPEVLKTLLHTAAMQRGLQKQSSMETAKVSTDFWAHSCTCAFLAENIAEITAYPFPEEAFIAGLIHDIGRLALQTGYPAVYGRFSENFGHDTALLEMERRIFKMDHAEIAAKALRSWQLDSLLVDAVQYHTESSSRILQAFSLVRIVSLACRMPSSPAGELETDTLGQVLGGLFAEKRQGLITNANEKTRQLAARLNIPFPADRDDSKRAATESHFRQQARECALLQSALPGTSAGTTLPEIIRMVFSACDILLCIRPAFCLMPDHQLAVLKALWHPGYPQSPGYADGKTPGDIEFSLQWEKSHVVQAFLYGELKIVTKEDKDELPLADQQLFHLLKTDKFICMPMIAKERNRGIIVFGLQKNQHTKIDSLRKQLEQFGVQAAKIFTCLPE